MRFLGDMGISPVTIEHLRKQGHNAKRLLEENLERLSDQEVLAKAIDEAAIVVTSDLDFGDLLAASQARLPSVIILRLDDMRPENVNRCLDRGIELHAADLGRGAVVSVSEKRIRRRRLPIH